MASPSISDSSSLFDAIVDLDLTMLQTDATGTTTATTDNGLSSTASSDFSSSTTDSSVSTAFSRSSTESSAFPTSETPQPSSTEISSRSSSLSTSESTPSSPLTSPSSSPATLTILSTASPTTASSIDTPLNRSSSTALLTANDRPSTSSPPVPTALSTNTSPSTSRRSAIIASSVVCAVAFLLILLLLFFGYKRYQRRKITAYIETMTEGQQAAHARARLLEGEDMDMGDTWSRHYHDDSIGSRGATPFHLPFSMHNVSTRSLNASIASRHTTNTQNSATVPHLLRARGSETGSIFHEGVWPPPGEESRLVDPLVKANSHVDLSRIVDDIMGSNNEQAGGYTDMPAPEPAAEPHPHSPSGSESAFREDAFPPSYRDAHNRAESVMSSYSHSMEGSFMSQTGLLPTPPAAAAQPKRPSPLAQTTVGEPTNIITFATSHGPSTVHWLKRSPRSQHPSLDKPEAAD